MEQLDMNNLSPTCFFPPTRKGSCSCFSPVKLIEESALETPLLEEVRWEELGPLHPLGAGEFCIASATSLRGRFVAVKRLKPEKESSPSAVRDLYREVTLLSRSTHANVISTIANGNIKSSVSHDGLVPFLCMELLASSLFAELPLSSEKCSPWTREREVRRWPLQRALHVGVQLARALRYCHDEFMVGYRLMHRDLKPSNIGFAADGRVLLFDFGLCRLWKKSEGEDEAAEKRLLTGITGSMRYMAPEVALSKPYNHKAEVFSFTSVLYECLAHQKPFYWMTPEDFISEACHGSKRCKLPKGLPDSIVKLMTAGWAASPDERPDAAEVVSVLEAALALLPEQPPTKLRGDRSSPPPEAGSASAPLFVRAGSGSWSGLSLRFGFGKRLDTCQVSQ